MLQACAKPKDRYREAEIVLEATFCPIESSHSASGVLASPTCACTIIITHEHTLVPHEAPKTSPSRVPALNAASGISTSRKTHLQSS
jgi:hypothetical protein